MFILVASLVSHKEIYLAHQQDRLLGATVSSAQTLGQTDN